MASIKQNPNGTWTAVIYVGRDSDGKMLREYVTKDLKREVLDAVRKIEQRIKDGNLEDISNMTLSAYLEKWNNLNCPAMAPTTARAYRMYARLHIIPALGKIKMGKLTPFHFQKYLADQKNKGLTSNTLRKHYWYLSRALREALRHNSPLIQVKAPLNVDYAPVILTDESFERMWHILHGTDSELPFLLGAWCGLRLGEIGALKWNDIRIVPFTTDVEGVTVTKERLVLTVDESMSIEEEGAGYMLKGPKSKHGYRTIVAPDAIRTLIDKLPRSAGDEDARIFTVRPDWITKRFHKAIVNYNKTVEPDAQLPTIRFHDLRHFHATALWKAGFDAQFAANRLGHDILVMTKTYTHMDDVYKLQADEKVNDLFSATKPALPTAQNTAQNSTIGCADGT
jgi:integrase